MPPKPRPGSIVRGKPKAPGIGAPDVVTTAKPKDYATRARVLEEALGAQSGMIPKEATSFLDDAYSQIDMSSLPKDPAAAKEAVIERLKSKGMPFWREFIKKHKQLSESGTVAPASAKPDGAAPDAPQPAAAAPTAASGSPPKPDALPAGTAGRLRQRLAKLGMDQKTIAQIADGDLVDQVNSLQKATDEQKAKQAAASKAAGGKAQGNRSAAKQSTGRRRGRPPKDTVLTTEGEAPPTNVDPQTPTGGAADLASLPADQLEKLLAAARLREAGGGSPIVASAGSPMAGTLPTDSMGAAGVADMGDQIVASSMGPTRAVPPDPAAPQPAAPSGVEPPRQGPPPDEAFSKPLYNPFGTTTTPSGVTKDRFLRSALRNWKNIAGYGSLAGAGAYGIYNAMTGENEPPADMDTLRERAIEARRFKQQLWGAYDEPTTPITAPQAPDMQQSPENRIRALQQGVR